MRRFSRVGMVGLAVFAAYGMRGHSQDQPSPDFFVQTVGLPAIDRGVFKEESHAPYTPEAIRRAALRSSLRAGRQGRSGATYVPGRVIVKFRDAVSTSARLSALSSVSRTASILARLVNTDFDLVRIDSGEDPEVVALELGSRSDIEYAQPAYRVHAMFVPNDPLYRSLQWNFPLINLERAWDLQPHAGASITVAVVDTGMAYMNATITRNVGPWTDDAGSAYPALGPVTLPYSAAPQLVGAGSSSRIVAPRDFIWNNISPLDFDGHGTHVSGTIGQLTNDGIGTAGIAFNVKLMPVKVLDSDWDAIFGSPFEGTDDVVAQGIRYAADNGAKVINLSLGRTGPSDCGAFPNQGGCAPVIEAAINYAVGKGCFVVAAGGNEFLEGNPTEVVAEIASRIRGAVSVGAVDSSRNHAFYSSTGPWIELVAPGGSGSGGNTGFVFQQTFDPDFIETFLKPPSRYLAPRFDVFVFSGYAGTSMAVAHVSGVAAMVMQQGITDPAAVESALETSALDLGGPGRDNTYGFGMVDARNALRGMGLAR